MKAYAAAAVFAALLTGCASVALAPRNPQPFDLLGRVLVTYSGGALTANMRWEHTGAEDRIWLMTPTGQTLAFIVDSAQGATLTRADQRQYSASSVEALTRQALGWSLPLSLLQYWVRGQAAPGAMVAGEPRSGGRLTTFAQDGWQVVLTYYEDGAGAGQVRRVDLNDGANEIRLVVDTWRDAS